MTKFWGLTVNVGKKFKQQVQEPFCISGAALEPLDVNNGKFDEKPVLLYLQQDQNDFLLCSLSAKQSVLQVMLDVKIGSGETIGFHLKGGSPKSKVHLTGYTLPRGALNTSSTSPGAGVPFKGQQTSILVTEPKSVDKQKKRVSIVETEAYGEREELDSDEERGSATKKLFNGSMELDSDDDDDDDEDYEDENSDSDLNDEDVEALEQLLKKGKLDPKTLAKLGADEDSDLEMLDEEEDDDDDDDDDDDEEDDDEDDDDDDSDEEKKPSNKDKKKQQGDQKSPQKSPQQKQPGSNQNTPNKTELNNINKPSDTKTPENKHLNNLKVKTPTGAGSTPMKSFSKGGVLVNDIKVGNGQVAKLGKMVTVYYEGRLKSNNKKFDATQNGPGFRFRLGKGEVIKGWDLGVDGMKVGGKRRLVIPAQLGYGKRGAPPDIPPNSTLVFEVELKNVS